MKKYKINEIFYSIQGEGYHAGSAAVFIRFSGCNLRCPFCDTQHNTVNLTLTAEEIKNKVVELWPEQGFAFVVLTGGEPTLQVDKELIKALREIHSYIAIETNGSRPIPKGIDFITVSPKQDYTEQKKCIDSADEVKIVFNGHINPEIWQGKIKARNYYLQPCDVGNSQDNEKITRGLIDYVLAHPWWQISLQLQKILNVR